MPDETREPSSFRDNAGFLFRRHGVLLRQVNKVYERDYKALIDSGLYAELVSRGLLVKTEELGAAAGVDGDAIQVLKPELVPFISYPYEWPFHALKDAALAVLEIQKLALARGMWLRDATAYNIQFVNGKPILIDSLSFEVYEEGKPWVAYRQFCQHFLAPLTMMAYVDPRLGRMSQLYMDGIPLDLASKLTGKLTKWKFGLGIHLHAHGRTQKRASTQEGKTATATVSKRGMEALIDSLETTVKGLEWKPEKTTWSDYYDETNYSSTAMEKKGKLVAQYLDAIQGPVNTAWDLGANVGDFSAIAANKGLHTVAWDFDHPCVDAHYLKIRGHGANVLPLVLDLTNPSPAIGWHNNERMSLEQRGPVDVILALAVVHHLAIANNVPLARIAEFFAKIGRNVIVEFVPAEDSQSKKLLANRGDRFIDYTQDNFEKAFAERFDLVRKDSISDSKRTLYLFTKRKTTG